MFVPIGSNSGESYQTQRSLRFRASANPYLNRIFGAGNQRTWAAHFVWETTINGIAQNISQAGGVGGSLLYKGSDDRLHLTLSIGSAETRVTSAVYRDVTAPLAITVAVDTTQAVAADRVKLYVNYEQVTSFSGTDDPALNAQFTFNSAANHVFAQSTIQLGPGIDGYVSEFYWVDGKALPGTTFGEFDAANNHWKPKSPAAVRAAVAVGGGARNGFGANGFYLPFSDPTSTTTLMYDRSQSDTDTTGNNWTASNISLTAGSTYDSMLDVPLGAGGQERGNYCTLNPLTPSAANISAGNLKSGTTPVRGTFNALEFNSQWEVLAGASAVTAGLVSESGSATTTTVTANKLFAFRLTAAGALDYKNVTDAGAWTSITTGLTGQQFPYGTSQAADWNFGQRPLTEAMTSGHKALHTGNLTNTTPLTSGSFTGNLSADGPCIWCNGTPKTLTINGNAVTFGTHADKLATGFKLRTSSSSYNSSGTNTWTATYLSPSSKSAFKYQNAKGNP